MIDFDRDSLDRVLPRVAGAADWDDVMSRAGVGQRRHRRMLVLAVVALVAVVSASAMAMRTLLTDRGFIGLPPTGATPSTPATGKLVASFWVVTPPSMSNPRRVKGFLYADGRLIWQRENDPHQPRPPEAANRWSSGLVEQRLTPAGVERMRSAIVSTGLFSRDHDLVLDAEVDPCFNFINVRNGGKVVAVTWTNIVCQTQALPGVPLPKTETATPEQARALQRLKPRLSDPASWLPAGSWKHREFKPYVPSRFAIGVGPGGTGTPPRTLGQLPARARGALRDLAWRQGTFGAKAVVAADDARRLGSTLESAGLTKISGAFLLRYRFKNPESGETVEIFFGPLLPHGEEPGYGG